MAKLTIEKVLSQDDSVFPQIKGLEIEGIVSNIKEPQQRKFGDKIFYSQSTLITDNTGSITVALTDEVKENLLSVNQEGITLSVKGNGNVWKRVKSLKGGRFTISQLTEENNVEKVEPKEAAKESAPTQQVWDAKQKLQIKSYLVTKSIEAGKAPIKKTLGELDKWLNWIYKDNGVKEEVKKDDYEPILADQEAPPSEEE